MPMKNESQAFTAADVPRFFDEIYLEDVRNTADRLRRASARMRELAARIPEQPAGGDETSEVARLAWTGRETLAHIAVLSRAYGVFAAMVAKGRLPELQLAGVISQRDTFGEAMAARPVAEIVEEAAGQHERTLAFLEGATVEQLRTECRTENGVVTPETLIRLPLVAHLEAHLRQLEEALQPAAATAEPAGAAR
jgi:hypothetical protein